MGGLPLQKYEKRIYQHYICRKNVSGGIIALYVYKAPIGHQNVYPTIGHYTLHVIIVSLSDIRQAQHTRRLSFDMRSRQFPSAPS